MSPTFSKNIQKFLVLVFTAVSLVVIILGVSRSKKTDLVTNTDAVPPTPTPIDTTGAKTFTGTPYQTPWGNAVASISVKNGKVVAATMPQVPNSPPSIFAEPFLIDQALRSGSANIQGVSGATFTSMAFKSSLENALLQAQTRGETITGGTGVATSTAKPIVPRKYRDDDDDDGEGDEDFDDDDFLDFDDGDEDWNDDISL